jgi:hypothetical protein
MLRERASASIPQEKGSESDPFGGEKGGEEKSMHGSSLFILFVISASLFSFFFFFFDFVPCVSFSFFANSDWSVLSGENLDSTLQ